MSSLVNTSFDGGYDGYDGYDDWSTDLISVSYPLLDEDIQEEIDYSLRTEEFDGSFEEEQEYTEALEMLWMTWVKFK